MTKIDPARTALLTIDLQNDFLHPEGAYGRAGQSSPAMAELPGRIRPLADALRAKGGAYVSAQFTLVPGRGGEPLISPHLKELRPFLAKGDFLPGGFGHALVDALAPADATIEKVAYSAFYQTRLEYVLEGARHRGARRRRHRHQWRRGEHGARRAFAGYPGDPSLGRLRRVRCGRPRGDARLARHRRQGHDLRRGHGEPGGRMTSPPMEAA